MDIVKLKARPRDGSGKSYVRKARVDGWIPAIYYGHDRESQSIEIDAHDFGAIVRNGKATHVIDLGLSEKEGDSMAIIKAIQRDVIKTSDFLHIDFQHASMDEKITVKCPVHIVGEAIGVTEEDGILGHALSEMTIQCLPGDIPEHIKVDVSKLNIGDSIHVSDISMPNVEFLDSPDSVVANVSQPAKLEEPTPTEGEKGEVGAEGREGAKGENSEGGAEDAKGEGENEG